MELRLSLAPADLNRFRSQPVLRTFTQGRPRNGVEHGLIGDGEEAVPYRVNRSVYGLAGGSWIAGMTIRHGDVGAEPFCFVDIRQQEGPGAPLCALLQAMAEAVPFTVSRLDLPLLLPGRLPAAIKNRPPPLHADMTAAQAFSQIADGALAHLAANHDCLIRRDAAEAIHQMRVALRRLRSAMSMFKDMLDDPAAETLRGELRWLQQTLGAARDWDVLLADTVAPLRETFGGLAGYERLCTLIAARRQQARGFALIELATPRLTKVMLQLAFWTERAGTHHPLGARPVAELARAILEKRYRRVRREMERFGDLSVEGRHQCRIDIKKLRYAVDFFAGLYPARRGQRLLPLLASLQDRLGALNDVAVARDKLEALVLKDGSADLAWAAGQLIGWHAGRSGRLLDQIRQDWMAVEKLPAFWRDAQAVR
jgi:CHAD domain-containing protein